MGKLKYTAFAIVITAMLLNGCSGIKQYKTDLPQNLKVITKAQSVKATLDIYSVDKQCKTTYQGSAELGHNMLDLGIPTGKSSYLVVGFSSSSFWRNSSSYMNHEILLFPRKGRRYELDVSYIDDIYNVELHEINLKTGNRRELKSQGLQNCHH